MQLPFMKPYFQAACFSRCKKMAQLHGLGCIPRWSKKGQPIAIFAYQHLRDVIHVSPCRYVQDFRSLAVSFHSLRITSGLRW